MLCFSCRNSAGWKGHFLRERAQVMNSVNPSIENLVITEEPKKSDHVKKTETAIGLEELKVNFSLIVSSKNFK